MKKNILLLLIVSCPIISFGQKKLPVIEGEKDWIKVIVTRNIGEVKGLTKVQDLLEKTGIPYGSQKKVRRKTNEKIKRAAAALKCPIVLITNDALDNSTVITNYYIEGAAYQE